MPRVPMRYFALKQEKEDEQFFHYVVAQDEHELEELMETYATEVGGTWKLQREISEHAFHKMCADVTKNNSL